MRKWEVVIMVGLFVGTGAGKAFAAPVTITGDDRIAFVLHYQNHKNIGKAGMLCANAFQ